MMKLNKSIKTKKRKKESINKESINKESINKNITKKNSNIKNKPTIISPQIQGGIGNQLFEIAAVYSYVLDHPSDIMMIECNDKLSIGHKQKINEIYKMLPIVLQDMFPNIKCYTGNKIDWDIYLKQKKTKWYENYNLDSYLIKGSKNKLIGVFASYMYFKNNHKKVLELFEFSNTIKNIANKQFSNIINNPNTVSIHLRRGDKYNLFIKQKKIICVVDTSYYFNAINKSVIDNKNKKQNQLFIIFSEKKDNSFVNKNIIPYLKKKRLDYIMIDNDVPAILSLYLISQCKNNIISDSTFSFWGAFLNKNKNKKVYAPYVNKSFDNPYKKSMYLRGSILRINKEQTMPEEWIKIPTKCI
jgi:hypothetical protein